MIAHLLSNHPSLLAAGSFLDNLSSGNSGSLPEVIEIIAAMLLSIALNLFIAALYKSTYKGTRYSQDFVQTLIMIGVVTTVLIMVVNGNGAVAFGMFAAFSMIRFRRNLGQSRDLGFVFFAMAIGMVVGAREYAMAAVITVIVSTAIFILTRMDAFAPKKASHLLTVRVGCDIDYDELMETIFKEFAESAHLTRVSSAQAGMMTELRYGLILKEGVSIKKFMEALHLACGNNRVVLVPTSHEFDS
ncbi:MAG: DUF4956 domain-containing protein [Roseibacillus sp.]